MGLLLCLIVLAVTVRPVNQRDAHWYESFVLAVLSPFQRAISFTGETAKGLVNGYIFLLGVSEENEELRSLNRQLAYKTLLLEDVSSENERLRRLLKMSESFSWETIAAEVIGYNPRSEFRLLTINRGSRHGLKKRMPVVSAEGLVGQIYRVAPSSSQVLLLTDPTSAVDARTERKGARGLVVGKVLTTQWNRSIYLTALEFVDRVSPIEQGDQLVTTGLDGIFPAGIPVGRISQVKVDTQGIFKEAQVVPSVEPMALQEVLIILNGES